VLALIPCLIATALLVMLAMSRSTPAWWSAAYELGPEADAQAESLEAAAMAQASLVRRGEVDGTLWKSEVWSVSLSESDANAWLGARLPRWVESRGSQIRWPAVVRGVRVVFRDGAIWVGAQVRESEGEGRSAESIVSVGLVPRVDEAGRLWFGASSVGVGRLTMPPWVLGGARRNPDGSVLVPDSLSQRRDIGPLLDVLAGAAPAANEPVMSVGDGRRVRLLSMRVREGRLELTCRTEAMIR
jgi:hypothetical protein